VTFIDASAIVGILAGEEDADELERKLEIAAPPLHVSPMVVFEAVISLARAKAQGQKRSRKPTPGQIEQAQAAVTEFLAAVGAEEIMISADIGRIAIEASKRFGKVVGHPADLNFGDCFAYACAHAYRMPLLFKGTDFPQTDIGVA
jgi:ribonuclease VapC